jgi:curli production assembly/transport component CsgF
MDRKAAENRRRILTASLAAALIASPAVAQEMVYKPINPSFGGDPFNSTHLLSIANAQNDYKAPTTSSGTATDQFIRQLQSRLLSSLASQVSDAIFGENPQDSGTIVFGDQVISFERGLESVQLVIVDNATGGRTEIEIPLLTGSSASSAGLGLDALGLSSTATSSGDLTSALGGL